MRPLLVGLLLLALATGLAILHRRRKRRSRTLPRGARLDTTVVMCTAGYDATRRGQPVVLSEHIVLAALYDRQVAALVESAGASAASLRSELDQHLPASSETPADSAGIALSPAAAAIVERAEARTGGWRPPSPIDLVVAAQSAAEGCFAAALLTRACRDLDRASREPPRTPERGDPTGERVEVVFWNDDVTKMEAVQRLLVDCFGKDGLEATHFMLTVHFAGSAAAGAYPPDAAAALVARATEVARDRGMPIRITLGPAAEEMGFTWATEPAGATEALGRAPSTP
ncbi:ATP-dependent Clp protease adaptor ClpS [Sorangium sp. So ce1389]|uniref:ATP-dependent Clp protease adaptor ClpS n=1 Tax=Sorangium sp. So ce1389 TaxID=3133336 RepID=UPI003F5E1B33